MAWRAPTAGVGPRNWVVARAAAPPGRIHVAASSNGLAVLRLVTTLSSQLRQVWCRPSTSGRVWPVRSSRFGGAQLLFYHLRQMELDPLHELLALAVRLPSLICLLAGVLCVRGHWHRYLHDKHIWCHPLPLGVWWHCRTFRWGCASAPIR